MPRNDPISLQFPSRGVARRNGLASAADGPFPTPWSMNVRLEDALTNRLRGGSFVGISADARPSEIRYRDRLLTFSSNAITATRVGDDTDTTLSADVSDLLRAALFQFSYGGAQGGTVVALVPHKDQFLLCFEATQVWVQQGDPQNGARRRVSDEVGIIGADAWCVNHDTVYFLSSRGLYSVGADGSNLAALSEDVLPEDLIGVSDSAATLTYEHASRGVYIHTTGTDWFYDTARKGFWPFDTSTTDSHVLLGPLNIGAAHRYGRLLRLYGTPAAGSATVTWRVIVGDTAESVSDNGKTAITASLNNADVSQYVHSDGKWTAGINNSSYPKARGQWLILWLASDDAWAFEAVAVDLMASGLWR